MAKKDAVSKLLAEEITLAKRIKNRLKDPPSLSLLDLANPAEKEELAASLWLDEKDPLGGPILDAFKAFGLDHRSVGDWYTLVLHLARVLFPNRRRPGRQRKWSDERLCRLLADVAAAKRKHPNATDTVICKWLEERYRPTSAKTLRRVLQDARNPTRNGELASIANALVRPQMLREAAPAVIKDASWTEADDQNVRSEAIRATLRKVIEEADKLFVH
jgi:hypothetical protein